MIAKPQYLIPVFLFPFVFACRPAPLETEDPVPVISPSPDVEETLAPLVAASLTAWASPTPTVTDTPTKTPSPTVTPTPSLTSTPDPYGMYTNTYLREREYGGGSVELLELMSNNGVFKRYEFRYPSDGLQIYGFLNVPVPEGPAGEGPYPVIIALHGYIDPSVYNTLDYTYRYADALARAGYVVFHPNLRNYPPSDRGENLFRVGMAVDVLNLIALVQDEAWPAELGEVLPDRIGMWGHSMGGGITTRVVTVSEDVQAAVLYAAMSGDERKNFEAINGWSGGQRGLEELSVPEGVLARISPQYFFEQITSEISIHHGRVDELVPLEWSEQTCAEMTALEIAVECLYYDGMPHTFWGDGDQVFIANTIAFFDRVLKNARQ